MAKYATIFIEFIGVLNEGWSAIFVYDFAQFKHLLDQHAAMAQKFFDQIVLVARVQLNSEKIYCNL